MSPRTPWCGFAESHALSFALLVYASSWFKLHYPAAFLAGLLRNQPMGFYSPQSLVTDARRHGVVVRRPDLTRSLALADLEPLDEDAELGPTGLEPCLQPHFSRTEFRADGPDPTETHRRDGRHAVRLAECVDGPGELLTSEPVRQAMRLEERAIRAVADDLFDDPVDGPAEQVATHPDALSRLLQSHANAAPLPPRVSTLSQA